MYNGMIIIMQTHASLTVADCGEWLNPKVSVYKIIATSLKVAPGR